ncbi:2',3'-cyclic-nucleotide 2'-phosphodiesterase/3'-nucleotidase [Pacificibacter maritimus]|uniref:2',3'-cyclic-nucleotide 2'-phosphodiesterase/3'-nucleotidase n=2 Tax=Pacificibacter maritimus TaxID=762213 RepID=A0A3N4UN87_9RHOB|nr:2',3'-cyclic-nucleotide 2'-phosphodiesterase/3'-nucleotidase [Pacificibacter maritimus]
METTDLHVHIFPYDYFADRPSDAVGLVRAATHINTARDECQNSILVDNGDLLQGNPMGDYIAYERGINAGDIHPIIAAMNVLKYDASTLGNHEFNYGLDFLLAALDGATFPVVCANVVKKMARSARDDTTLIKPYTILKRSVTDGAGIAHDINIGIIGFVPPQVMTWDHRHLEGKVHLRDIVNTARDYIPEMKEKGADIIIALNHSGIGPAQHIEGMENATIPLAALDGIDAIVAGHSHQVFPSPMFEGIQFVDAQKGLVHGKPTTMAGFWGSHLGLIDLLIERDGSQWRVIATDVETRPIAMRDTSGKLEPKVASDKHLLETASKAHAETLTYIRRAVGKTTTPLHSYFAQVTSDPSLQVVADAQLSYVKDMLKDTEYADFPTLSATAPFKAGGRAGPDYFTDVAPGNLAIKSIADLYLYPNIFRAIRISGAQVKSWLERSAGMFFQIKAGAHDQPLLNPDFPSYHFDVLHGVTYKIDLSQPSRFTAGGALADKNANRIVDLAYNGRPVTDDMEFIVATNNYRASGGGGFIDPNEIEVIFEAPDTNRDIVVRYVLEHGTLTPKIENNWSFTPLKGTTVTFETGPKAVHHLKSLRGIAVEHLGDGTGGFARFRIAL